MIKTFTISKGQKPTREQLQEVMDAKNSPIVTDEDAPELSPAMYKAFKSSVIQRNRKKNAQNRSPGAGISSGIFYYLRDAKEKVKP